MRAELGRFRRSRRTSPIRREYCASGSSRRNGTPPRFAFPARSTRESGWCPRRRRENWISRGGSRPAPRGFRICGASSGRGRRSTPSWSTVRGTNRKEQPVSFSVMRGFLVPAGRRGRCNFPCAVVTSASPGRARNCGGECWRPTGCSAPTPGMWRGRRPCAVFPSPRFRGRRSVFRARLPGPETHPSASRER